MLIEIVALLCVLGLALGQILFKLSAIYLSEAGSFFSIKPALAILVAMILYGVTSLVWIWVLQHVELGKIYPLMAFAFILVPIGSFFVFGERFNIQYFIGIALIMTGVIVIGKP